MRSHTHKHTSRPGLSVGGRLEGAVVVVVSGSSKDGPVDVVGSGKSGTFVVAGTGKNETVVVSGRSKNGTVVGVAGTGVIETVVVTTVGKCSIHVVMDFHCAKVYELHVCIRTFRQVVMVNYIP